MSRLTLDGKRLSDTEWLKLMADEEHAALEMQFTGENRAPINPSPAESSHSIPSNEAATVPPPRPADENVSPGGSSPYTAAER